METIYFFLRYPTGLLLRLAIPIVGTVILVALLRKLDAHWQAEAELTPVIVEKVECWKIKGCSEAAAENLRRSNFRLTLLAGSPPVQRLFAGKMHLL